MVLVSPSGSPTQWKATLSPRPSATWRSTQFTQALSRPPTNHSENGGSHSSTFVHGWSHCSHFACSAHQASGSSAASA